jgi:pimeloyl-ACP methyl ester carboxylesterase
VKIAFIALLTALMAGGFWLWTPDKSRSALEAKYLAAPTDFVDAAGIRLHVRDTGPKDRPAVILLHGFGASLHTWEAWAQALGSDYRVIRFDLPGFGLTGADPTADYSDARSMVVLGALMDRLGVNRVALVGNSMGGRIAWRFAAEHPDRVTKLVLISPDGFESDGIEYGKKPEVPAMVKLMRYVLPKAMLRMNLAPAYADPSVMTDSLLSRYYDLMLAPGVRDAMIARMEQTMLERPEPLLKKIEAPVLLLWGEKDALIPVPNAADYLRLLPHAKLVPLPNIGHLPQEEAPALSLAQVLDFLAEPGL